MFKTCSQSCILLLLIVIAVTQMGEAGGHECPDNEFYADCGDNCQTECTTLNEPCLIRHFKCPEGCYCNKGYARDANRKCVPIDQCSKK